MSFDITSLQRNRGPVQARSRAEDGRAVLKYIDVDDLVPSEDNFYSMSAIDELAGLIELSGGVKQPGLVVPLGGGKYKVISGHRRRLASLQLVKQGKEAFRKMPCMVEPVEQEPGADAEADELRAIDEAILLITTNGQRDKTDWDKVQEATRLRALLDRKRQFEKIPGETRKLIAEWLGTTPAQVGRYDSIEKHLIPRFKEFLADGKVNISVAYELSMLPEDEQCFALMDYLTTGALSIEDVKRRREKLRTPKPSTTERDEPGPAAGPKCKPGVYVREEPTKSQITPPPPPPPAPSTVENAGKIVNFPAPPSPSPAEDKQEEKDIAWAVLMMKTLHNYCEVMSAREGESRVPWADYAEALAIAIPVLRE